MLNNWQTFPFVKEIKFFKEPLVISDKDQLKANSYLTKLTSLGGWNGVAIYGKITDDTLICKRGQYVWRFADLRPEGFLNLSVGGVIYNSNGFLWVKRSVKVLSPNRWDFSCAGVMDNDVDPVKIIEKEALEEIGFTKANGQTTPWQPLCMLLRLKDGIENGMSFVYISRARDDWQPNLNLDETSEYCWRDSPDYDWWKDNPSSQNRWQAIMSLLKPIVPF